MPEYTGMAMFDNSLKLTKISLWISGIDLSKYKKKISFRKPINPSFLFYFNFIWLYTHVYGEIYCIYEFVKTGKSFEVISLVAPFPFICALATVKAASIYFNKDMVLLVLNKLRCIHPRIENEIKEVPNKNGIFRTKSTVSNIMHSTDNFLFKIMIFMCLGALFVITLFCAVPLVSMAMDYHKFGRTDLKLPYSVRYFFDPYSKIWWPYEYLHQVWSSIIVVCNIIGSESLFYAFCVYVRMHFELLCHDFERLMDSKHDTAKELRKLVLRHQELIELVSQIQEIYSTSMLFNIIISSFTICLCGFNITFIKETGTVFAFFNFFLVNMYQIFMVCFFGDMIRVSSTKVGDAIYKSGWYETDKAIKNNVLIIIMRSQKSCTLSAAKFAILNLSTFTKILSRSWSYFAVLKTMDH